MKKLIAKIVIVLAVSFSFSMRALAQDYPSTIDTGLNRWELIDKEKGYYSYKYNISGDHYDTKTGTYEEVMKELSAHQKEFDMAETQMTVLGNIFKQVGTDNNPSEEQLKNQVEIVQDEINKLPKGTKRDRLQGQLDSYKRQLADTIDNAKAYAEAQVMYAKAIKADDISDLSVYTSYMYTEDGFFGTKDIFPKIINSIVQAIFFIPKLLYFIVAKTLTIISSQSAMGQINDVVTTSKEVYDKVVEIAYPYLIFFTIFVFFEKFIKTASLGRALMSAGKYLMPFFAGAVLYSNITIDKQPTTVMAGGITTVKKVTDEFTARVINSLSVNGSQITVDSGNKLTANSVETLKANMFDTVVKKPFEEMNFKIGSVNGNQDVLNTELLATKGKTSKVEEFKKKHEAESNLSFGSVGGKFLVAIASAFKSIVLTVLIEGVLIISHAMNYFVILLLAFLVIVLILVLIPKFSHVLVNFLKTVGVFTTLGSGGLLGTQLLLYVNSRIELSTNNMKLGYFLTVLVQVVIWTIIYKTRHHIFGFLKKGQASVRGVARSLKPTSKSHGFKGKSGAKREQASKMFKRTGAGAKRGYQVAKKAGQKTKDGFYKVKDFAKTGGNQDEMDFNAKERKNKHSLSNKDKRKQALKEAYTNHRDELLKNPDKKEEILKNQRKTDFMMKRQKERQEQARQEKIAKGIIREKGTTKTQPREPYRKVQENYKKNQENDKQKSQNNKLRDRAQKSKQKKPLSESYQPRKNVKKVDSKIADKKNPKSTQDKFPSGIEIPRKEKIKQRTGK
ncbi:hypothetical protein RyT2_07970 [Pseudolactococcus yaeyamensis]